MANKTNTTINGKKYFKINRTVGHKLNENGVEIPDKKTFYGKSKQEAEEKFNAYMEKLKQGIDPNKKTYFGIEFEKWIYTFFIHDTRLADSTKSHYIAQWQRLVKDAPISSLPLDEVTAYAIQDFYNNLDCPPSAIRKINNLIRRYYKYLEQQGLARDFTSSLVIPNDKRKHEVEEEVITWTNDEINIIMNNFEKAGDRFRLRFLIVLAYNTGCRVSELLGLKYNDFNMTKQSITIKRQISDSKQFNRTGTNQIKRKPAPLKSGSSYRTIPLNETVMKELKIHQKWHKADMMKHGYRTDYVFTTNSGGFYDKKNVRVQLEHYYKKIGLPMNNDGKFKSIHTYRHTFATNLVRNGVPIQVTSSLLGHADINMTAKYYVGVDLDDKKRAVESLNLINEEAK